MGQTALGKILPALKVQNPFGKLSVQGGKRDGVPEATERFGSGGLVKHVYYIRHQLISYCHPLPEIFLICEYTILIYIYIHIYIYVLFLKE